MKYCFVAEDYREAITALGLKTPDDWMGYAVQDIIVDRTTETRRLKPPAPLPGCYAKIYRYPRWDDRAQIVFRGGLLGRSRARVEFDNLQRLAERGLAPRVLAYGQNRHWGMQNLSFLVIEEVTDATRLDTFVAGPLQSLTPRQRRDVIRNLAAFTQTMNTGGYVNSEYHWRNILVQETKAGHGFQVIDPSSSRLRYRLLYPYFDLATLDVCAPYFFSRTERLRFFKLYQNTDGQPLSTRQKKHIRRIAALREKIARKELKRYRKILPVKGADTRC